MSRQQIIEIAASQKGITESPSGSNKTKYGVWYGLNGEPWCAIFVSWVYNEAGHPMEKIDTAKGYQSCQSGYNFWKANNRLTNDPQQGDVVLYDWKGDGHCDHTGIFIRWTDENKNIFEAWEGNTAFGDDSNGGIVMLRKRNKTTVKAFAVPMCLTNATVIPVSLDLKIGDKGSNVTVVQKKLHDLGYEMVVDGEFGKKTEKVVKQFQKENKVAADGIITPAVLGMIQSAHDKPNIASAKMKTGSYIKKGDAGSVVLAIQKAMNKKGDIQITADGIFGNEMFKALKAFQLKNNLVADGIAGPEVFGELGVKGV